MYESNVSAQQLAGAKDSASVRRDMRSAQIVNAGIALQERVNTVCALEYLRSEGISDVISNRVLYQPALRRTDMHIR